MDVLVIVAASPPASTAAGGNMAPTVLYHMSRVLAVPACATTGGKIFEKLCNVASDMVAEHSVPAKKPLGCGGSGPAKNMIPEAIIAGAKSGMPTIGSSSPRVAHAPHSPAPARIVSTTFGPTLGRSTLDKVF